MSRNHYRSVLAFLVTIFVAFLLLPAADVAGDRAEQPKSNPHIQELPGLFVEVGVTPPVNSPGDTINLMVSITNSRGTPVSPEVSITLPATVSLDARFLPRGTTFDIRSNRLLWLPVLSNPGSRSELIVELSVKVADIREPEQNISVIIKDGEAQSTYSATFWTGVLPRAFVNLDPPQAAVGQPVKLSAHMDNPGDVSLLWELGDGRTVEAINPEVVYAMPGTYQVTVHVSNPLGIGTATALVTVFTQPVAKFEMSSDSVGVNQNVSFTNASGGETPLTFTWDFGDGMVSSEKDPVHQYVNPGVYEVRLVTRNEYGESEIKKTLAVGQTPAIDIALPDRADAGSLFTAQVFADENTTDHHWDMGDGRTYEGKVIQHAYWAAGDYPVTLTISNEYGSTTIQRWISVRPGRLLLYIPLINKSQTSVDQVITHLEPANSPADSGEVDSLRQFNLPPELTKAERMLAYLNEARRINNVRPLNYDHQLSVAAQIHAEDMAQYGHTSHSGTDGSSPAYRIQKAGYRGGYGGETTTWGIEDPLEAVIYWLNSPPHRLIILSPSVTDVGIGSGTNYDSPSIWYWAAEFASLGLPFVEAPAPSSLVDGSQVGTPENIDPPLIITLLGPPRESTLSLEEGNQMIFTWSWHKPLDSQQRFVLYLRSSLRSYQIGSVRDTITEGQYQFKIAANNVPAAPGSYSWQVRLEDGLHGTVIEESEWWPVNFGSGE